MKNITCLFLLMILYGQSYAQECNNGRYKEEVFSEVDLTSDIKFGQNSQATILNPNNIQELYLDLYQPDADTLSARPLIIWGFGGGFVAGSKVSPDIVELSTAFAKRGYVCAAIDCRLSTNLIINGSDTSKVYEAVLKAMHDMRASIRFFYKDAATVNNYKIDTTRIYLGGVSAGALAALHIVHLDELSEVPAEMQPVFQATGGLEGNSGNPGYSDDVAGVVSLCGALLDTALINPQVITPVVSMHGTSDSIVPYGSSTLTLLDIALDVDGSSSINSKLNQHGIINDFYTWYGTNHTPFVLNQPDQAELYMDTTIGFVSDFLYDLVCDDITSSMNETLTGDGLSLKIFPNPNNGHFFIQWDHTETSSISVFDVSGREVFFIPEVNQGLNAIEIDLPNGIYTVQAHSNKINKTFTGKFIVN